MKEERDYLDAKLEASKDDAPEPVLIFLFCLTILNIVVFSTCLILVLCKTRRRFYYRMGYIYIAYLASFTLRFMMDANRLFVEETLQNKIHPYLKVLNVIAIRTKSIFFLYFIIIVREMKLKLSADNPNDFSMKWKKYKF